MFIILSQVHSTVKGPGADRSKPLPFSLSDEESPFRCRTGTGFLWLLFDYPTVMVTVFVLTLLPLASVITQYIRRPELAAVSVAE